MVASGAHLSISCERCRQGPCDPPPDRPAHVMQKEPEFLKVVFELRDMIEKLQPSTRAGD